MKQALPNLQIEKDRVARTKERFEYILVEDRGWTLDVVTVANIVIWYAGIETRVEISMGLGTWIS